MNQELNYCIKKTNILLVEVRIFTRINGNRLIEKPLRQKEKYRKVLFYDHMFIDFLTGDIIDELYDKNGDVKRPIRINTMYIGETYLYPDTTDDDLIYAASLYENTIKRKKLMAEKKLIKFPQKIIY